MPGRPVSPDRAPADLERSGPRGKGRDEAVVNAVLHDDAARCGAALAGLEEGTVERNRDCAVEIGVVEATSGFLPPISTARAWRAAPVPTFAPTACEPVNEMPSMPGWSTIAAPTPPVPSTRLNTPAGAPHSWMIEASACAIAGVTLAGFMTTQLPNASAGADFHAGIAIRKFPRRDQAENTDRLAAGRNVNAGTGRFERLAVTAQRLTREVLEYACGAHDLAGRLGQRLAFLARQQFAERLGTRHDGCADLVEQVGPYLGRGRGPCRERGARCPEPRGRPRRHRRSGSSRRSHACRTG